ncbi:facilitated trehalose transporter Tret1-like [Leptopilina heterotoma]|uniref:facilitated trehalose transporter Tret1-like n=1 Tax=Leptopilina heterotoma TaxID=63436 RepID=UPI001CA982D0|nr:facilitated trehalose transporter Tret1-like [Leptopilina heterotoma]
MSSSKKDASSFIQYTAAITASLTALGYGLNLSWTSPVIPYLTSKKSHIPVTKEQCDLISSIFSIGLILGYLVNPIIIDRTSRKKTLLIYTFPQILSWLLIIFIKKFPSILIGRIISGFGYGGAICGLTVYLSEIGTIKNRGIFLVMIPIFLNLGFLLVMILGAFSTFDTLNLVMLMVPLIFCVTFVFMPDSSYFQRKNNIINNTNNKTGKNKKNNDDDNEKMMKLMNTDEMENYDRENEGNFKVGFKWNEMRIYKLVNNRNNQKALLIEIILAATITLSGSTPILFNTQQLLSYSHFSLRAEECTIILAGITIIACLLSIPLVERIKRKVILLVSGILATIGMLMVGVFFLMEYENYDVSKLRWMPLLGLTVYLFMNAFGFLNLFYIFQCELFMSDVKSQAVTISKITITFFMFMALVRFQYLIDNLGLHVIFFLFATISAVGTYLIFIITPETQGKSVEEIQLLLKTRKMFF